jgi:hypothetical protein
MLNKFMPQLLVLALLSLMTSGCAINRATASLTPGSDLSKTKSFYVVQIPEDTVVHELIKTNLTKRGYSVSTGPVMQPPYKSDAVLTYVDKWQWDFSTFLMELTITIRNPATNYPMAVGNSFHSSLSRKPPEGMVDEVLTNIFNESNKSLKEASK